MSSKLISPRTQKRTPQTVSSPYTRTPMRASATTTPRKSQPQKSPKQATLKKKKPTSIKDDKRFAKYNAMTVPELRTKKNKMIEAMNFDESEFIEKVIQMHVDNAPSDAFAIGSQWIKERIDELIDNYFQNLDDIENTYRDKEIAIRENEYDVFQKIRERHLLEIEEIETARTVQLHVDENSICGQTKELERQARVLAKANDFEGARNSAKKAQETNNSSIMKRQQDTNLKYDRELKLLLSQQENQLQILQDRLQSCINDNEKRREEEILSLQKESSVFIKSNLQKIIIDGSNMLNTLEQKAQFTSDINASYMKDVYNFEKEKETKLPFLYI